jgi:hypothetical protein
MSGVFDQRKAQEKAESGELTAEVWSVFSRARGVATNYRNNRNEAGDLICKRLKWNVMCE